MKKIIAILLVLAAGTAVFASGTQEENENGVVELDRGQLARNSFLEDLDKVNLSGTVKFESPVPELVSGGKDYTLIAPGAMMFTDYVSEGDKIKVTGYVLDDDSDFFPGAGGRGGMGFMHQSRVLDGNMELLVETVEINGKTYQLPWVSQGFGPGMGMFGDRDDLWRSGRPGPGNRTPGRGYGNGLYNG